MNEVHICEMPDCVCAVSFDDEPFCYGHSADAGADVSGYSFSELHANEQLMSEDRNRN